MVAVGQVLGGSLESGCDAFMGGQTMQEHVMWNPC